jgi:hypothetical protein
MRRLKDYLRFLVWNAGLGYIALWLMTFWTFDHGGAVFGHSGVCQPADAKVLFYWACDPASPLSILAALANTALTVTVWAPVYVAAATVDPSAMALALPIMLTHALGLPAALLVIIRVMSGLFTIPRRFLRKQSAPLSDANEPGRQQPRHTLRLVKPRQSFGLRGAER